MKKKGIWGMVLLATFATTFVFGGIATPLKANAQFINTLTSYPQGVFAYKPTPEEDAKFGFRYAFVDKEGVLRKFAMKQNAELVYESIFGVDPSTGDSSIEQPTYPKGIFAYAPTREEAKFGFRYAFVDKEGELRKFATKRNAELVYNSIYGSDSNGDSDVEQPTYPKGIFPYTPTQEETKFGFRYAFVDKEGELRKFATKRNAELVYNSIYGSDSSGSDVEQPAYPKGIFAYTPTREETKFGFRYAFVDKEGELRKFATKRNAELVYNSIYGNDPSSGDSANEKPNYPRGVFSYTPTPEEEAKFGFRYAFVDKDGNLRKFVEKRNAELVYKNIFGEK